MKIEASNSLGVKFRELEPGDVFTYLNQNHLYMKTRRNLVVRLYDGAVYDFPNDCSMVIPIDGTFTYKLP